MRAINVSFNGVFQSNNDGGASVTAQLSCPEEGQFSFVFEQSLNEMGEPEGEFIMKDFDQHYDFEKKGSVLKGKF